MPLLQNITVLFLFFAIIPQIVIPSNEKTWRNVNKKMKKEITKKQRNYYKFVLNTLHNSGNDAIIHILPRLPLEHGVDFV